MKTVREICCLLVCCLLFHLRPTQSAVSSCHALLEGTSGTFTSPNYPETPAVPLKANNSSTFPDNGGFITCQWEIRVPKGQGIQLKFGDFDMDAKPDVCEMGEVEIFTGIGKKKKSLDMYCPGNDADAVILRNNTATVVFRRPSTFTGRGFLISFIAITPEHPLDDFVTCRDNGVRDDASSFSVTCPSGCVGIPGHNVWGKLPYRDDSCLCLSAVHAGVISDAFGGRVDVKKGTGSTLYFGEVANNVTSRTGAISDLSIYFPKARLCRNELKLTGKHFSASSSWEGTAKSGLDWTPDNALMIDDKAWSPSDPTQVQWLQVSLPRVTNITSISTKGSTRPYKWCSSYKIKYSLNSITWDYYKEEGSTEPKLFVGNTNHFAKVRNNFVRPAIVAKYIRIYPTPVTDEHFRYAIKLNLEGCLPDGPLVEPNLPVPPPHEAPRSTTTSTTPTTKPKTTKKSTTSEIVTTTSTPQPLPTTEPPTPPSKTPIQPPKGSPTPSVNHTQVTTRIRTSEGNELSPTGPLNERSIIIIAIVAALAVTSILLATLVLVLVRKRKKEPKIETMVPKYPTSQNNATYHAGMDSARFLGYRKDDKRSKRSKKNGKKQKYLFKNDNYSDSYPLSAPREQMPTMQNSRGGMTIMYDENHMSNGEIVTSSVPIRASYTASDVAGPSIGLMHPGLHEDDADSFASDDEDHEYQVIPDPVDGVDNPTPRTLSKASTGSSMGAHSRASDTMPWHQVPHQAVWGHAGDAWNHEKPPNPASPVFGPARMTSFGQHPQTQRSRSGTFPHHIHNSIDMGDLPISPGPPKTAPPTSSFTAPRYSHRKRGRSQSPSQTASPAAFVTYNPPNRYSTSSGGSSHSPVEVIQRVDPSAAPYYSSVPEQETHNGVSAMPPNGHLPSSRDSGGMAHQSPLAYGDQPINGRRPPSYKVPRNLVFSSLPSNGAINDVRHGGSDPLMATRQNGMDGGLRRSTSRSESFAKQRSGYDQLYRNKNSQITEKPVVLAPVHNYHQLNLHAAV